MFRKYKNPGIYKIKNLINERFYIGSSFNVKSRINQHKGRLRNNKHPNPFLQNDWNKCGERAFSFEVFKTFSTTDKAISEEQQLLEKYHDNQNMCYNIAKNARSPMLGRKHSTQTKNKIKATMQKEDVKRRLSIKHTGKKLSPETRRKISETQKGRKKSIETKRRMSQAQKGRIVSEKTRAKLSKALTGKKHNISHEELQRRIHRLILKNQKTYHVILISPDKKEFGPITNLSVFARKHNLTVSLLHNVINRIRNHHQGWKLK